ncbi:CubicO group peptidase (beta-lactamase class C family) [Ereboglobus sp. PH5-10]|uniref:serine hydrolase domain-containing protein n=1 Tax=unclassified Ereboglobus TaxID=2626932 RepID=UPI00240594E3|nr:MULTISPECIES: serine hydrolase domain-containing protein [unclassified Ereboglobus]MDF9826969.1 CubicO group peptidase (beta-lactamase class C family) [Ereboglobus sp. PH5-10]
MNPKHSLNLRVSLLAAIALALAPLLRAGPFADTARPYVDDGTIAGTVFLAADGKKVLACEAVGLADIAGKKPMREDSLFWIASMSKPMTAAAFMMLVDEGKVSLDDPVSKYIPAFAQRQKIVSKESEKLGDIANYTRDPSAPEVESRQAAAPAAVYRKTPITIRHLLSHTAGLRYSVPEEKPTFDRLPLSKLVDIYAASDLLFEPGTDYSYANTDINTIGRIIEIVSGMPYEDFLQKRLLDPLGMSDTTFWPDAKQVERIATCYRGDPKKRTLTAQPNAYLRYPLNDRANRHPFPGGGLFSSARDVARFGQFLLNKGEFNGRRLLSEKAVAEMTRRQTPPHTKTAYGLGLNLGKGEPGGKYGHGGAYSTNLSIWPKENLVTVFMVQRISKWGGPNGGKIRPALEKEAVKLTTK